MSPRLAAELDFDYNLAGLERTKASLVGIEATRASFEPAWDKLLSHHDPTVTSTAALTGGAGHELFGTGALVIQLKQEGKVLPFVAVGGGIVSNGGDAASVKLVGNYGFGTAPSGFPEFAFSVHETDTVTLTSSVPKTSVVGLLGIGFKYHLSRHWGIRAEAREYLSVNRQRNVLDARPSAATSTPPGALDITYNGGPPLQFAPSPNPWSDKSSLSGPPIQGFETFKGVGTQSHLSLAVGVYLRL